MAAEMLHKGGIDAGNAHAGYKGDMDTGSAGNKPL